MPGTDVFVGEIATELVKQLITVSRKVFIFKSSADHLKETIDGLLPILQEIKYSGVELSSFRQAQLDRLSETLRDGLDLCQKVLESNRWNVYKNVQLSRKMNQLEKKISTFFLGTIQAHVLADVHHVRFQTTERFDQLERSTRRIEQRLESMKTGVVSGGWVEHATMRVETEEERGEEGNLGIL